MGLKRQPAVIAASVVIGIVTGALAGTVLWSILSARSSQQEIERATVQVLTYRELQNAVADQAFAEAGYRRAPSPRARALIDSSAAEVEQAVAKVRAIGDTRDASTLSYALVLNRRYVSEVRRTIDEDTAPGADDRVAGPALDAVRNLLESGASRHIEARETVLVDQRAVLDRLAWLLPSILFVGMVTIGLCWAALVRAHRSLRRRAADSERRAGHDPLTGLANRNVLTSRMEAALAVPDPDCAVLLVDLDHFKPVNDTFGHASGDAVLVAVSDALRGAVRSSDLVARFGGDEFALVLVPGRSAGVVVDKVLLALSGVTTPDGAAVSASIGSAVAGIDGASPQELLEAADAALYRAKQAGRGRVPLGAPARQ